MTFDLPFELPTGWHVYTVEELVKENILEKPLDGNHGGIHPKSSDYVDSGIPFVMASDMANGSVDLNSCKFISAEQASTLRKGFSKSGDVLLSHKATIGRTAIVQENQYDFIMLTPQVTYYRVTNRDKLSNQYLKAYFDSNFFQTMLGLWAGAGSTRAYLGITGQLKLPIILPPIEIQNKIEKQALAFNAKLETNRQINQTLEEIAQAIFKSWFVDFEPVKAKIAAHGALIAEYQTQSGKAPSPQEIAEVEKQAAIAAIAGAGDIIPTAQLQTLADLFPNQLVESELGEIPEGWHVKALDEVAHYQNGLALQKFRPEKGEEFLPVLKIAQLKAGVADGKEVAKANIKKECIVDNGDVIFSWSGSLVVDIWCGGRVALNQHLFKVTSQEYPKWFYLKWTKHHLEEFQQIAKDKAVTMGHIKRSHLTEAKCVIPSDELLQCDVIESIVNKQVECRLESVTLSELREVLLPELLSGRVTFQG
ncbi:restriction endonuclease subunit S [Pseudoalteromonas peptidolytica]|uniref:restriction endonuclease subunit S n=1 Tax=Pseudoalteromonas peptidolytica TaxID=61150 RepID=UPI00298DBD52|nr:restriction endonuclease subunit S [Pseudoalteromonas peptidolytica]MDW7548609.1 restriction endonuclease subunit S [Pseudoalteromonas peptidolytica]